MHKLTAELITRIIENLPEMSEEVVQFWSDRGLANQAELRKILLQLSSPDVVEEARKTARVELNRTYGETNS